MGLTLRLDDAEIAEIREAARRAGVSMHAFAHDAVMDAARDPQRRRDEMLAVIVDEDAETLDRLADS